MHLHIAHFSFAIPVAGYEPKEHPQGEAIIIHVPPNDPRSISIVPGMEGYLEDEEGLRRHVRVGKKWRTLRQGQDLRIEVRTLADVEHPVAP